MVSTCEKSFRYASCQQVACCGVVGRDEERIADKPALGFEPSTGILQVALTPLAVLVLADMWGSFRAH